MEMIKEIKVGRLALASGEFEMMENGVLVFVPNGKTLKVEEFQKAIDRSTTLTGGNRVPYLVDERGKSEPLDTEAKRFLADNLHKYVTAVAILEDSAIIRFLTHTFISMYRPRIPIRLFKRKVDAISWLEGHRIA